jgi:catechol 2,3-dioxygenase-like lactoylglutathione lyase family enzyme
MRSDETVAEQEFAMRASLDHTHIFASDLEETIRFFTEMFGASVVWDEEAAGARNVRLAVGKGFLHIYDQSPKSEQRGTVHHLGIETDDLDALVAHMTSRGLQMRNVIRDEPQFRYIMVAAPDNLLIELFQCKAPDRWKISC